jgi:hypothetical protein
MITYIIALTSKVLALLVLETEHDKCKEQTKKQKAKIKKLIDGPDHCIHCDEGPCVFIQIESRLCENDAIYFSTRKITPKILWRTTTVDVNARTSMGRVRPMGRHQLRCKAALQATSVLKMEFALFFLPYPRTEKSWDTKQKLGNY